MTTSGTPRNHFRRLAIAASSGRGTYPRQRSQKARATEHSSAADEDTTAPTRQVESTSTDAAAHGCKGGAQRPGEAAG